MRPAERSRALIAGSLLMVAGLVACGDGDGARGPLADADRAMAELDEGQVVLQLSATAGTDDPAGPVGFRMEGPFSFAGGGALPVLDLRYTRLLGDDKQVSQVLSTGEAMYVVVDGRVAEIPSEATGGLRLGEGDGGFTDLGIAGWVDKPVVSEAGEDGSRMVSGEVDVADLLSDLARVGAQVGIGLEDGDVPADAARRLRRQVRHSKIVVELGKDDLPRALHATVDFGGDVSPELRDALGPYASTRIELTLAMERLSGPLRVAAPGTSSRP